LTTGDVHRKRTPETTRIGSTEPFQAIHYYNGNAQDGWIMNEVVVNSDAPDNRRFRVLMVTCLDRLARSTRDLLNTVATIARRLGRVRRQKPIEFSAPIFELRPGLNLAIVGKRRLLRVKDLANRS
jgi:hypothetical protein